MTNYTTRLATPVDGHFLRLMVYEAAAPFKERPDPNELLESPRVRAFIEGWGRAGDHGVVAESNFEPVGAAWFRVLAEDDAEGGFVGGETPELLIAVEGPHRGRGVGGLLLTALAEKAREERYGSIGLSVQRANLPAVSLFRRMGFVQRREHEGVITMQLPLT